MVHPLSGFQPCVCLYASILKVSEVEKRKQRLQRQESKLQQRVQRVVQSDASERCVHAGGMHACVAMLRMQLYFWFRNQVPQPWQHVEPVLARRCPFVHDAGKRVDPDPTTEATPFADHFGAVAGCVRQRKWRRRGRHITDARWACRGAGRAVTTRRCGWTHDTAHVCLVSRQWCSCAAGRWPSVTEARRLSAAATAPACVGYLST